MQPEEVDLFLKSLGDISRYDRAFRKFYAFCKLKGVQLESASNYESAGLLISFNEYGKNEARNSCSALVTLPGFEQLRFSPIMRKLKQAWNTTNAKYGAFWDGGVIGQVGQRTIGL